VAKAGFNIAVSEHDYGIDGLIKDVANHDGRHFENGFGINFQLKSSSNVEFKNGQLVYDLESKNYNDLVFETAMLPNILILFVMPHDEDAWLCIEREKLTMQQCAWWYSLVGLPTTDNAESKRISIPIQQIFTPENLIIAMDKVKRGIKL
jgi:hypothetical protein